jgi:hypothetical protein
MIEVNTIPTIGTLWSAPITDTIVSEDRSYALYELEIKPKVIWLDDSKDARIEPKTLDEILQTLYFDGCAVTPNDTEIVKCAAAKKTLDRAQAALERYTAERETAAKKSELEDLYDELDEKSTADNTWWYLHKITDRLKSLSEGSEVVE